MNKKKPVKNYSEGFFLRFFSCWSSRSEGSGWMVNCSRSVLWFPNVQINRQFSRITDFMPVVSSECDHLEKLHVWTSPELLCGLWTHVASSRQYLGNQILSVRLRHIRLPLLKDWGLEWHMGIFLSIQILRRKKTVDRLNVAVHFYYLSIDLELWGWQRKAGRRGNKIRFIFLFLLLMIIIIVNILHTGRCSSSQQKSGSLCEWCRSNSDERQRYCANTSQWWW